MCGRAGCDCHDFAPPAPSGCDGSDPDCACGEVTARPTLGVALAELPPDAVQLGFTVTAVKNPGGALAARWAAQASLPFGIVGRAAANRRDLAMVEAVRRAIIAWERSRKEARHA